MELSIRNKWVTIGGSSVVKDVNENDVLKVKGKIFTFTAKKYIMTLDDEVKYITRRKFWRLFRRRALVQDKDGNIVAKISRKIFSLHDRYFVESSLGQMEIMGNILGFNYSITLDGKEIGHISRKISLRDSFVLTIDDNFDYMLFVALVIAIDIITDDRRDAASSNYDSNN